MNYQALNLQEQFNEMCFGPFGFYARNCLTIRTKDDGMQPFALNKAQDYLDELLEEQLRETGRVRVIILKGRQQGISTYVQGRFFRKVTTMHGIRAFTLTHAQDATENLFGMAQRFVDYASPHFLPKLGQSNAKTLNFEVLDSGYGVGTAGNKAVGRSQTIQLFHGSEVGFWPNAEEHTKGVLQAVPDAPGTEIILESTANGVGNYFYNIWKDAEHKQNKFKPVFIPWFWSSEYQKDPPEDFELSDEEVELKQQFDLTDAQLCWRRDKISELKTGSQGGLSAFRQEYPMTAAEAFQYTGGETLITAEDCMRARKREVKGFGPVIVGVDPSYGIDRFAIVRRQGFKMYGHETYVGSDVIDFAQRLNLCINILKNPDPLTGRVPDMLVLDWAAGAEIADELIRLRYGAGGRVRVVKFGEKAQEPKKYRNRRQEIYARLVNFLIEPESYCQIPDDDEFQADLCATPYKFHPVTEAKELRGKDYIRQEFGFSPDLADAAALTLAFGINSNANHAPVKRPPTVPILSAI